MKNPTQVKDNRWIFGVAICVAALQAIHGSTLGLTDDEAYYWILSQHPSWGYAYHPPAIAWMQWLFQKSLGGWIGAHHSAILRIPAALFTGAILGVVLLWLRDLGLKGSKLRKSTFVFLAFPAVFGSSWMMVPDLPLFLGWALCLWSTWKICAGQWTRTTPVVLLSGAALGLLSKYNAILFIASSGFCLLRWGDRNRWRALFWLTLGVVISLIPIFIWNIQTEWGSLLYQIRDRHSGHLLWIRYFRFWLVEFVICGPFLIPAVFSLFKRRLFRGPVSVSGFLAVWIIPAAVIFCVQPLFSDFKIHWVFVVWLPLMLLFTWNSAQEGTSKRAQKWIAAQQIYSFVLIGTVILACHFPLIGASAHFMSRSGLNPKWDVTNDMYGWARLPEEVKKALGSEGMNLPVVGSRYQTASQAAFVWPNPDQVVLLPRSLKEQAEWPALVVSDGSGPEWPSLLKPILFVADNRYSAPPEFKNATCGSAYKYQAFRGNILAKEIYFWKCVPVRKLASFSEFE